MADVVEKELSYKICGAAFKVRDELGYGFLEKVYENALAIAIGEAGLLVEQQVPMQVLFHGQLVGTYIADLLVEGRIIVEVKATEQITKAHVAQTLNYLKATGLKLGIILNFNKIKVDVERIVL